MSEPERTLADNVKDAYYADMGVRTGSAYNDFLVGQRQDRLNAEILESRRQAGSMANPLFPYIDELFDRIPDWLKRLAVFIAFVLPSVYAVREGYTYAVAALLGGAGVIALILCWKLTILSIKLVIVAGYVALVIGVLLLAQHLFLK